MAKSKKTVEEQIREALGENKQTKYRSQKTEIDGIVFDSKKEAKRYSELKLLERSGEISDLELQKVYELIPKQYGEDIITKKGKTKRGPLLERECTYIADFVYKDSSGKTIVEDAKGMRTEKYRIKRKLMLWVYGIRIVEI